MENIAICGSHPATVYSAPYSDPNWSIWACSPHNFERRDMPRVDEWYELHTPAPDPTRSDLYLEFVRSLAPTIPVWMRDRTNHPLARPYPDDEVMREFPEPWFTSSIAYMMAAAILRKPKALGLWGIMQRSNQEYAYQRPGIQSFLWEAHRRGITVIVPKISDLFKLPDHKW